MFNNYNEPKQSYRYNVGIWLPCGRSVITIDADNRAQAMNIAWGQGHTVVDCNYHDHD